ncbi:hypothetical protein FD13_GL001787 [Levilactobacillus senmaizukei DSM 21775 = NBRC 103853]|uniref:Riboflavin transporter n=1 Tax=Levilactobacillus senmaizukei DSM 21775 = NBRC 103853 TaxID=1423803 RepID=A0A0R2DRJ7_9LACO|nr:ECF transporter S component [Levilactobacillus senmaizukei]KRN02564.1 hypothetical protein FD13_GL001787 [Levilactobacillus senmaizukei DSM 21775 = NBRC 103853]
MEKSHSGLGVRAMVLMALFAGIATVLMFVSVPILPYVSYMKLDISDLFVLLGMGIFGPAGGVAIAAIKELLYFILTGFNLQNFIGILTAFVADVAFILPIGWILKRSTNSLQRQVVAVVVATISLTVILSLANWWVVTPLYLKLFGFSLGMPVKQLVLTGVVPFNLIKGIVLGVLFILLNRRLGPWIEKHRLY